jgi:hypothetical protein
MQRSGDYRDETVVTGLAVLDRELASTREVDLSWPITETTNPTWY